MNSCCQSLHNLQYLNVMHFRKSPASKRSDPGHWHREWWSNRGQSEQNSCLVNQHKDLLKGELGHTAFLRGDMHEYQVSTGECGTSTHLSTLGLDSGWQVLRKVKQLMIERSSIQISALRNLHRAYTSICSKQTEEEWGDRKENFPSIKADLKHRASKQAQSLSGSKGLQNLIRVSAMHSSRPCVSTLYEAHQFVNWDIGHGGLWLKQIRWETHMG